MQQFGRALTAAAIALALGACGPETEGEDGPRPVLVAQPQAGAADAVAAYAGEVRAREESLLSFRVGGTLVRRLVEVGDQVRQGQVLAELDPDDLRLQVQAAAATLAAAEAEFARARADRDRYAALAKDQLVSRSALDAQQAAYRAAEGQVRVARAQRDEARNRAGYARLLAPRDGVVAERRAEAGQVVAAGQPVFALAADGAREVAIALPETRLHRVSIGQAVQVEPWNARGERIAGRIREIAPAADPDTRTYAARVALPPEATARLALGQSARVYVPGAPGAGRVTLPLAAVQRAADGEARVWLVDAGADRVRALPVEVVAFGESEAELATLLPADAWVVVAGGHLLSEGQEVVPVDRDNRPVSTRAPAAAGR